ncbi:Hint domain-containing protein [Gymnodinialimonas sp.]
MLLGGIVINEILVDPNGTINFDTDGNGTAASTDEYVELFNDSTSAIDISGLQLWDAGVGRWFTFPSGTILQPGAHAMVMSGVQTGGALPTGGPNDLFFDAGRGSPLINNGGDNVILYDPTNDAYIQATFNGDAQDDPTQGLGGYSGFSATATKIGAGEDFGSDTDGQSLQRDGDGADTFVDGAPTPGTTNICFADGTHLATPNGEKPVEALAVGDLVLTADNGPEPITWMFAKTWTPSEIAAAPNLAPVLIAKDALGAGVPNRDLRVSQLHRVSVRGAIARRMFGTPEVLIPAKALLPLAGVTLDVPESDVTYYHVMLARHEVVLANAVRTESLFLGPQVLASVPAAALEEICVLMDLSQDQLGDPAGVMPPARTLVKGRRAARLVQRHAKNRRALTDAGIVARP